MRMGRFYLLSIFLVSVIYISVVLGKTPESAGPHRAVVVELFTSEGCSSCPPADELLGHLRQDLVAKNIEVIPLGFHVDYWNTLGWKDRFSSAAFTQRQEEYERNLRVDGAYTPQMIIDGTSEFVGSSSGEAQRSISHAAGQPELAAVKISTSGAGQLAVQVSASGKINGNVMLAITEDNLTTHVGSGENNGHTLHHTAVVRELRRIGQVHEAEMRVNVPLKIEKDWKRADLRAVVFVQEGSNGKIYGASSVALAELR